MSKQPTAAEIADQIRRNFADWALASGAPMVARFNRAIEALGSHAIEALEAELPAQDARGAATMSSEVDIVAFLLARIAEDEADAADIQSGRADYGATEFDPDETIMRQTNPARILAECKAKRAIVELHKDDGFGSCGRCAHETDYAPWESPQDLYGLDDFPCETVRHLATIYADHPDYQQVWR